MRHVGEWMSDPKSELHTRIKDTELQLDRFERQAANLLTWTLALALASYAILIQMIP
jgi:hypothetical protein